MSRKIITVIVVILLLGGIAVMNYVRQMDPTQLAARGVGRPAHSHGEEEHEEEAEGPALTEEDYVAPIGPESAPVKIQAVYRDMGTVQGELRPILEDTANRYAPNVRVEFLDGNDQANATVIKAASPDLYFGLIINGEVTKEVPVSAFGMVTFVGSPAFEEWSVPELHSAIERELQKQGVQFTSHLADQPAEPAHDEHAGHSH